MGFLKTADHAAKSDLVKTTPVATALYAELQSTIGVRQLKIQWNYHTYSETCTLRAATCPYVKYCIV